MSDEDGHDEFYIENTYVHAMRSTLEVDGVEFAWWATDDEPALVTVSSPIYGHKVSLTSDEPEECARRMAAQLLSERMTRTATVVVGR